MYVRNFENLQRAPQNESCLISRKSPRNLTVLMLRNPNGSYTVQTGDHCNLFTLPIYACSPSGITTVKSPNDFMLGLLEILALAG